VVNAAGAPVAVMEGATAVFTVIVKVAGVPGRRAAAAEAIVQKRKTIIPIRRKYRFMNLGYVRAIIFPILMAAISDQCSVRDV